MTNVFYGTFLGLIVGILIGMLVVEDTNNVVKRRVRLEALCENQGGFWRHHKCYERVTLPDGRVAITIMSVNDVTRK